MKKFTRSKFNVQARSSRRLYCLLALLVLAPCPRVCADAASSQIAALRELGVTEAQVDRMLIDNPRALFERQGAY